MAPLTLSDDSDRADFSFAKMKAPILPGAGVDMIALHSSANEKPSPDDSDSSSSALPSRKPVTSRSRAKKARKAAHQTKAPKPALRPAKDILSRIRHDPSLNESDFIVGYIDRHNPEMMEMDVSAWKGGVSDVTDEEWIPQHRITYFRKKGDEDGRRIWDRGTRLDRLFGSGVPPVDPLDEARKAEEPVDNDGEVAMNESEDRGSVPPIKEETS